MSKQRDSVIAIATRSVKWSALNNLFPRFITPLTTVLLAALLEPEDFGLVAVSTLILAFAQVVIGLGWGPAVIQRRDQVEAAATLAFWISLGVATILYGLLWVSTPAISVLFGSETLVAIARVSGLAFFFQALGNIPTALLQRQMAFRRLFWVTAMPMILSNGVAVVWALLGGGVWALVLGPLIGTIFKAVVALKLSAWLPGRNLAYHLLPELTRFSIWVMLAGLQTWLFLYADNTIAGIYLGPDNLGLYSLGYNLGNLLPGMIISSLAAVAYPSFCALEAPQAVGDDLTKLQQLAAVVVFPVCFGIAVVAVPVVNLLYGSRWDGLGQVMQLLALAPGMITLWSLNAEAYRAIGRPDLWTKVAAANLVILLPALVLAGSLGLFVYTAVRLVGSLPLVVFNVWVMKKVLKVSLADQWVALRTPLLAAGVMFAGGTAMVYLNQPFTGWGGGAVLLIIIALCALIYVGFIWLTDRALFRLLWQSAYRVSGLREGMGGG